MKRSILVLCVAMTLSGALCAQVLDAVVVAGSLSQPLFATAPKGDLQRVFILEQYTARIKILRAGAVLATPFLDIGTRVIDSGDERGLLGLAFHPNYAVNGYFYVYYINNSGSSVVARYSRNATNPDLADFNSELILLTQTQPASNHNGGMLAFGPDGYLYIGLGDGGGAGDTSNNAQTLTTLLGKILRIDVDTPASPLNYGIPASNPFTGASPGRDEIWAYGVRNPWRFSFDEVTGELYIGDVGQNAREEISWQPALDPLNPSAVAGRNYGWRCREGIANFNTSLCSGVTNFVNPIYDYAQGTTTGFCVTGGYVYRGCAIPALYGHYVFGDYSGGRIWSFTWNGAAVSNFTVRTADLSPTSTMQTISAITSSDEEGAGELYVARRGSTVSATGQVSKIVPAAAVPPIPALSLTSPVTVGGVGTIQLTSAADPNEPYLAAFALGVNPGLLFPDNRRLPINLDDVALLSLTPGNGIFAGNVGNLDGSGVATMSVTLPMVPGLTGLQIFGAAVIANPLSPAGVEDITCALPITIQ